MYVNCLKQWEAQGSSTKIKKRIKICTNNSTLLKVRTDVDCFTTWILSVLFKDIKDKTVA